TTVSEQWVIEVVKEESYEEIEEVEEIVEDYEVSEVVACEEQIIVGEKVVSTERSISSSHDDTVVRSVSEKVLFQEGARSDAAELSRAQYETLSRAEVDARATASHGSASSTTETKKPVFDLSSLPQLGNVGINVATGAADGVIDLRTGTAETLRELPAHLRPRAWVSLHVGGWQNAPHELEGFMRLDDQSGERLMEDARDAAQGKAQESTRIDNLRLPEIVALFAQKLYGHFEEELPEELTMERLRGLGPHRG
ncbi:hypothetical protein BG011_002510, partial [Mortierella polycephala]